MELDPSKLLERVNFAETAIYVRLRELETSSDGAEERMALRDAMKGNYILNSLRGEFRRK
jgi:hypothetical protein